MRILIIEDDEDLNKSLCQSLTEAGYAIDTAFDGENGFYLGSVEPYDAVILDIGLPKKDGLSVIKAWRDQAIDVPVLMLTARDSWADKVAGIDAGADDYVAKPFHVEEVLARLRALLRRSKGHASNLIHCSNLSIDSKTSKAYIDNEYVKLTSHEFRLLSYMIHHQDKVISKTELIDHIYDQDYDRDSNTIEVFVGRLRRKLNTNLIKTERGLGYRLSSN